MKREEIGEINKRIKNFREKAKLTQIQAAEILGMKRNTYAHMERHGHPRPEMIKRLAEIYSVTAEEILYGEKKEKTNEISELINSGTQATPPLRLNEQPSSYFDQLPFLPSGTELSLIKTFHILSKEDQKIVLDITNKLYQADRNK